MARSDDAYRVGDDGFLGNVSIVDDDVRVVAPGFTLP